MHKWYELSVFASEDAGAHDNSDDADTILGYARYSLVFVVRGRLSSGSGRVDNNWRYPICADVFRVLLESMAGVVESV